MSTAASLDWLKQIAGHKVKDGPWQKRTFPVDISDGLQTKWPSDPKYRASDPRKYLIVLATEWAARDGTGNENTNYYLEKLPDGYGVWEIDQPGGPQIYKRLFGHPSGRFFDSIVRFQTHFEWLLDGRAGDCKCFLCGNFERGSEPPKRKRQADDEQRQLSVTTTPPQENPPPAGLPQTMGLDHVQTENKEGHSSRSESTSIMGGERSRRPARHQHVPSPVDEEGTKDEWKSALTYAYKQRQSEYDACYPMKEVDSIDWISERETIPRSLTKIELQHSFIPRIGELVLWIPDEIRQKHYLMRSQFTKQYMIYDSTQDQFVSFPQWRAGVVAAVPSATPKNGMIDFPDILDRPVDDKSLNTLGFRIETLPDPNDDKDKSLSKQYKYLPVQNIRPLSHWQVLLSGVPQHKFHRSILHALTCMTSVSVVEKVVFIGGWYTGGYVKAKGAYLGSELITVGDTIRLVPQRLETRCSDVMLVDSIRLQMDNFKKEYLEPHSRILCSGLSVTFLGQAYTLDKMKAYRRPKLQDTTADSNSLPKPENLETVKHNFRPVGAAEYGDWYPLHAADQKYEVSYDQVLGRLYEADAIRLWSGQRQWQQKHKPNNTSAMKPDINFDLKSIMAGRRYATKSDERIPELPEHETDGIRWVLSDYRAQSLAVATLNGLEIAAYQSIRTPETLARWRYHLEIDTKKIDQGVRAVLAIKKPEKRAAPNYVLPPLDFDDEVVLRRSKKRGRPTGSRPINGRLYTNDILKQLTGQSTIPQATRTELNSGDQGPIIKVDEVPSIEIRESPPTFKGSSQMAEAAIDNSEEKSTSPSVRGTDIEDDNEEDHQAVNQGRKLFNTNRNYRRSLQSRIAAYGNDEDETDDDGVASELNEKMDLERWQKPPPQHLPSRSEVIESVEGGSNGSLADIKYRGEIDSVTDEEDHWDNEEWKAMRNARGGTSESEGGDYRPDQSQ